MEATDDEFASLQSDYTSEFEIESIYKESALDELPPDEQYPEGPSEEREVDVQPTMDPVPLPVHSGVELEDLGDYDTSSLTCPSRPPSVWGHFDPYNSSEDEDKEYVGFAALPNQVHWKSMKTRFEFTLMVVGESGLGKSTLINSLFLTDLYKDRTLYNAWQRVHQTVAITKKTVDIVEKGVKLRLNIVDTPGFGDSVDDSNSWEAVIGYIDQQFEQFHRAELSLNRKNIQDSRVHCCLYFISPYGHGLRPIDVKVMKALHEKVNIVPVVAKADCLTTSEIQNIKARILNDLDDYRIKVYQIPECDQDEDELFKKQYSELKMRMPFAVIGSNTIVEGKGRRFRARLYPWGVVEVENPAHCDFVHLRNMLVCTYMHHLKDITQDTLYENYRMRLLC